MANQVSQPHELSERIELCGKLRQGIRVLVAVVVTLMVADAYCLTIVSRSSAEYYVCLMTLMLLGALAIGALIAAKRLTQTVQRDSEALQLAREREQPDPWKMKEADHHE